MSTSCQEWTCIYSTTTDGAWAARQGCDFNLRRSSLLTHWLYQLDAASPPQEGAKAPPDVGFQSRDREERRMWLECAWGQTVRAEAVTPAVRPCFPVGLGGIQSGSWTPTLDLLGGEGWDTCSSCLCVWAALCYSPVALSSDVSAPSKPCSG